MYIAFTWPMKTRPYFVLAILLFSTAPALAEPIIGRASVIDGDTLEIRGQRIRLHGIDAPESSQLCKDATGRDYRCGQKAALALSDKIGAANIACERKDTDRYGRIVATCELRGESLNGWLVHEGYAIAYRQYGGAAYDTAESEAKAAKRGVWAGSFTAPWKWRHAKADAPVATAKQAANTPAANCQIKGNINRRGDHIYHVPGSRWYERTVINAAAGERWFCSETEARAAGWRAPRGR